MLFEKYNEILKENANRMLFKEQTVESDIILIVLKHAMLFGLVYSISEENDNGIREVNIKILSIPPLQLYFNLTDEQLDGEEPFILESNEAYMKAIDFSKTSSSAEMEDLYKNKEAKIETDEDGTIIVPGSKALN